MTETRIPLGNIIPSCPQCGAALLIEHDGINANPDDPVSCPTHGFVGSRAEVFAAVTKKAGDQVKNQIRDEFEKMLTRRGFKFERK